MARIRSIKPEFWTDEKVVSLSPLARLLFIGMWNFVDEQGRGEFSPARLKMQILPADATDVSELIEEIERELLITVYVVDEKRYFKVNGFEKHQKADVRYPSKHPVPPTAHQLPPTPADFPQLVSKEKGKERVKENGKGKDAPNGASNARETKTEFEAKFWPAYPNKVGKPSALKAFLAARKKATTTEILEGLERYKAAKPVDRAWCNPATFLNQERWEDQPAQVAQGPPGLPLLEQPGQEAWRKKLRENEK